MRRPIATRSLVVLAIFSSLHAAAAGVCDPADEAAFVYTTRSGDTLIGLSTRLLAEPARWREVASANALRNPHRIGVGRTLRIPVELLRSEGASATVTGVAGPVTAANGDALAIGQTLDEGAALRTGSNGNVTVRLVDGTVLRLRADSRLQLTESRRLPGVGGTRSATRLDAGRVEIKAGHSATGLPGFRVRTPQGVLAVRGTEFRVEVMTDRPLTRGEVLEGTVAFADLAVTAGHGSGIDADGRAAPAVPLAPAPDLRRLPALQERALVRFSLEAAAGIQAWRGQVARDAGFDTVVADLTTTRPELRFADLPDGEYVLRVRAIDEGGLEGYDADHRFRLKARPEAPFPSSPSPGAVLVGERVEFAWAANADAARYRLQVAGEAGFEAPLREPPAREATSATVEGLAPGRYRWRVRSIRADGDAGPWGDPRDFEIRPPPPTPAPPRVGDRSLHFSWDGAPGQSFDFQLARDDAFTRDLQSLALEHPRIELPLPGAGRFWIRLRSRDADGFVGPWTSPQSLVLPNCLRDGSGGCVTSGDAHLELAP